MVKKPNLFDTHCHLFDPRLASDPMGIVNTAFNAGVNKILVVESDPRRWETSVDFCSKNPNLYIACGIHPCFIPEDTDYCLNKLVELIPHINAVGEIGLNKYTSDFDLQKQLFTSHMALAKNSHLPVILHCRKYFSEIAEAFSKYTKLPPSVLHCYSGSAEQAVELARLGLYFSFGGVVTFENAKRVHKAMKSVPIDRLLLETDSPDMAPVPYRGDINKPEYLPIIAAAVANSLGVTQEEIEKVTFENSTRFISGK